MIKYPVCKILPEELEEVHVATNAIGAGSYGQCILKRFLRLGIQVVEKLLHDSNLAHIYQEAYYMQLFSHRCVPHLLGVQVKTKPFSIVMEFLGYGIESLTIHKLLYDTKFENVLSTMTHGDWCRVCYDITDALNHLHQKEYLHCDLKTDNVLVCNKKGYLIDFGKVRKIGNLTAKKYSSFFPHIAPEVLNGHPASIASDIYSLGKIIVAIGKKTKYDVLLSTGNIAANPLARKRTTLLRILTDLVPLMTKN